MRVLTQNILAPEVLLRNWRTRYQLPLLTRPEQYDELNLQRLRALVTNLKTFGADVICLQNVSTWTLPGEDNLTVGAYLARELNLSVVGTAWEEQPYMYNYPPEELQPTRKARLGVMLLVKPDFRVEHLQTQTEPPRVTALLSSRVCRPLIVSTFSCREDNWRTFFTEHPGTDVYATAMLGTAPVGAFHQYLWDLGQEHRLTLRTRAGFQSHILTGDGVEHGLVNIRLGWRLRAYPGEAWSREENWWGLLTQEAFTEEPLLILDVLEGRRY